MRLSSHIWGIETEEILLGFPCDKFTEMDYDIYYRGITIKAQPEIIFKWLCQLRVAPYSYDWIDNFGRKSPQKIIPGLDKLKTGETLLYMFKLVDFEINKHITLQIIENSIWSKLFGNGAVSYLIIPQENRSCRLLVKCIIRNKNNLYGKIKKFLLPWGDLIMMRRQLLNFKMLSEKNI